MYAALGDCPQQLGYIATILFFVAKGETSSNECVCLYNKGMSRVRQSPKDCSIGKPTWQYPGQHVQVPGAKASRNDLIPAA